MTLDHPWQQSSPDKLNDPERARCRATRCLPGEIAEYVLLPGDPARAAMIAEQWFEDGELVMANREFHSYTGSYKGTRVSVISTGLGSPGAGMVMQDLPRLGVQAAIRVGTAGSANEDVKPGDLVIATAAVREEGVSRRFISGSYPAVADFTVTQNLHHIAALSGANAHTGIVHTSDTFSNPGLAEEQEIYRQAGVLAFEMEAAALMVVASLKQIPVGCILSIDGYVSNVASGNTAPNASARDKGIRSAISIALDTLVQTSQTA